MQFLYPIGLLAFASLILPVIIHLWRVSKGRTLKIGSISLLGESAVSNSKSLQISNWLLFLLRCVLFILVVLILAAPILESKKEFNYGKGWILLHKQGFKTSYNAQKKTVDSLLSQGFEIHNFGPRFEKIELRDTIESAGDSVQSTVNYSSLLKTLNQQLPNNYPVWIFSDRTEINFDNQLASTHLNLNWRTIQTESRPSVRYAQIFNKTFEASITDKAITYRLLSQKKLPQLNVLVQPSNSVDARFVKAGVSAIGSYLDQEIKFLNVAASDEKIDVIFWLSDAKISPNYVAALKPNGILFKYGIGKISKQSSLMFMDGNAVPVKSHRSLISTVNHQTVWWKDGFGNPMLALDKKRGKRIFTFYGRLNPQWTDLVWQETFVTVLFPVIYANQFSNLGFQVDLKQPIPLTEPISIYKKPTINPTDTIEKQPLTKWIWIMAALVLLAERLLSYRQRTNRTNR